MMGAILHSPLKSIIFPLRNTSNAPFFTKNKKRMNQLSPLRTLWLAAFLCSQSFLPAQGKMTIQSQQDSLTVFKLDSLDILTKLAGDKSAGHPYYTFLWIFGDGSFVNGARDSVFRHVYENRRKLRYNLAGGSSADVAVYATGNYSGGSRPPKAAASPGDFFRSPGISRFTVKPELLLGKDPTPVPLDTSVIDTTKTAALRLQLNKNIRPQDTLVAILSFRQPGKLPAQDIGGQVFLFYNSKVKKANRIQPAVKKLFKDSPPPPPPALTHGKSDFQRSLVQFANTQDQGAGLLAAQGIADFNNVIAWTYDSLTADGRDERHLFVELANDSTMWELFKNDVGDTLRFLAVMTALSANSDLLGPLPNVQDAFLESSGIQTLLRTNFYSDGAFINLGQGGPTGGNLQSKIIGVSEVASPVVSSHDPNKLSLYACQCPDTTRRKVVGVVDYSNDGKAPTALVKVTLKVPEQLNLSSIESLSLSPAPAGFVEPDINLVQRTITWTYAALLQPAETAGFGHPSTQGQIVFSIDLKDSFDISQIEPVEACIVFDVNAPMCTLPVSAAQIISTAEDGVVQSALQCNDCKTHPVEGAGFDWCCYLLWGLGLLLLVVIVWVVKKIV